MNELKVFTVDILTSIRLYYQINQGMTSFTPYLVVVTTLTQSLRLTVRDRVWTF